MIRNYSASLLMLVAIAGAWLAVIPAAAQTDSGEVALKAAIQKELVDGDLKGAIAEYKNIIARKGVSRPVAATALLHLGRCYEKMGQAEARKAYERLVREYPDQRELAATARSRLAALNGASRPALTIRRVYDGKALDWCNGLSSDVRYLSHPDWDTGNLAVADLNTGEIRRVTSNGSINDRRGEFAECSIFSPDDKQIAFFWENENDTPELRTVVIDGSRLRVLYRAVEASYLMPFDWSADGKQILTAVSFKDGSWQIVSISASDGSARVVKKLDFGASAESGMRFSPDGQYILYATATERDSKRRDIFLIAADGSGETQLVRHPADDHVLGWSPDGKKAFFASDRTGAYGVWTIEVKEGQPRGTPALAKADLGSIIPVRFLSGTLYYTVVSQLSDVYIASVDPESGKLESAPALARGYFSGSNAAPDWSSDGNFLAYRAVRAPTDPLNPPALVSILDLRTGQERQIRPALDAFDFNDGPHWSPDGRSLLVIARQHTPEHGVYRVDVETGATTPLVKAPRGQWLLHAVWSRDGNSVFYTQGNPARILRRDLVAGNDVELASIPSPAGVPRISLSPDGQWLAFTWREAAVRPLMKLGIVPAGGGEAREIYGAAEGERIGSPVWTPNGRYIYFPKFPPSSAGNRPPKAEFWRVTADGRMAEQVGIEISGRSFHFSPDGRRIVFSADEWKSELWALENTLAAPNPLPARKAR